MKSFKDIDAAWWRGKRVLVRIDVNVPIDGATVKDQFRIEQTVPTIEYLRRAGARVVLMSHLGRAPEATLAPIARILNRQVPVTFVRDVVGTEARMARDAMGDGDVLLLENLRRDPGEMANDPTFAGSLAYRTDIYVNDAFAVSHRAHTSIVGVPKVVPGVMGPLFEREVENLSQALTPSSPSLAILGGAKFETKEPLIKKLLEHYDHLFIAGALVNDVFKAQGLPVGRSVISEHTPEAGLLANPRLLIPGDVLVEDEAGHATVKRPAEVCTGDKIVDIGPEAFAGLVPYIQHAKTILWNGPTGWYEAGYDDWTQSIAQAVAKSDAFSIVGGGDTIAAIHSQGLEKQFSFLSTAGGAMLEYLLNGTLPGIEALQ